MSNEFPIQRTIGPYPIAPDNFQEISWQTSLNDSGYFYPLYILNNNGPENSLTSTCPYYIAVTEGVLSHPHQKNAARLIEGLKAVENPWSTEQMLLMPKLVEVLQIGGFPPVISIVATEGDFTATPEGTCHGKYVSIVGSSIRLGKVQSSSDMPLIIIFGEESYNNNDFNFKDYAPSNQRHELWHYLTLISGYGSTLTTGEAASCKISIPYALGYPFWEGLAYAGESEILHALNELEGIKTGKINLPEEHSFHTHRKRTLGGVNIMTNEILTVLILKALNKEEPISNIWSPKRNTIAVSRFLLGNLNTTLGTPPQETGWLTRIIYANRGLDFDKVVLEIKIHPITYFEQILSTLRERTGGTTIYEIILKDLRNNLQNWHPFGSDSLR